MNTDIPIYDLYDVWYTPWWCQRWFILFCIVTALIFITTIIWLLIKKYRTSVVITPWDAALRELAQINLAIYNGSIPKEVYTRMSAVVRRYIEQRYGFVAQSSTDDEFCLLVQKLDLPQEIVAALTLLMNRSVTIKFGTASVTRTMMVHDAQSMETIIKKTVPVEPLPNKAASSRRGA
jgi:hypothetical protein